MSTRHMPVMQNFPGTPAHSLERVAAGQLPVKMPGKTPAMILIDPKYPHNGGGVFRDAACFGFPQVWITGSRLRRQFDEAGRLPREERMRQLRTTTEVLWSDRPFDEFPASTVFVGVEVLESAEVLTRDWEHPADAAYVFGPEDGSLPKSARLHCSRFLIIPSRICLNLQVAAGIIAYHRTADRMARGVEPLRAAYDMMQDGRGFADPGADW